MGTYSISSTVTAEPGPAGATYICQVTHISLEEPLRVSMRVLPDTGTGSVLSLPPLETPLLPGHLQPCADAHLLRSTLTLLTHLSQSGSHYHYEFPVSK